MIKLIDILKEIGEPIAGSKENPLPPIERKSRYLPMGKEDGEGLSEYVFTTDSGINYKIMIEKNYLPPIGKNVVYDISFAMITDKGHHDYDAETNDVKNMYKVMANVIRAVKEEGRYDTDVLRRNVIKLEFTPSKRIKQDPITGDKVKDYSDTRRETLYMNYVEKMLPNSVVNKVGTSIEVDLPKDFKF